MPDSEKSVSVPPIVKKSITALAEKVFDIIEAVETSIGVKVADPCVMCVICGKRPAASIIEKNGKTWRNLRTCAPCAIRNLEGIGGDEESPS